MNYQKKRYIKKIIKKKKKKNLNYKKKKKKKESNLVTISFRFHPLFLNLCNILSISANNHTIFILHPDTFFWHFLFLNFEKKKKILKSMQKMIIFDFYNILQNFDFFFNFDILQNFWGPLATVFFFYLWSK